MIEMGIMVRERAAQESALMEQRRRDYLCGALQPEPQLPCGWEKCLDLKSGLIYFKDWNSGTLTYRDPRHPVPLATGQRIGLLSISLSTSSESPSNATDMEDHAGQKLFKRTVKPLSASQQEAPPPLRRRWIATAQTTTTTTTTTTTDGDSSTSLSTDNNDDHSLELSLNLPGTTRPLATPGAMDSGAMNLGAMTSNHEDSSVCTVEKVRTALERSNWLNHPGHHSGSSLPLSRKRSSGNNNLSDTLSTVLSLPSSRPSSSRESNSPSTSQCSDSECFTSPSVMSYEGDDDEVQQLPRLGAACRVDASGCSGDRAVVQTLVVPDADANEVMVTVGCKSCLMYVMLSKAHPCCPRCGDTDVLLELPAATPLPSTKKQRVESSTYTWSWCTA